MMSLELSEAFCQNYPEQHDGTLDCISIAVTMSFNKHGTLLAVGCNDGRIVIWDIQSRAMAKIIGAHVHPVCSLSWSRSGFRLLSSSTDYNVCIWDVVTGDCLKKHRFPSPVLRVEFDPNCEMQFLACPLTHLPLLMDDKDCHTLLPSNPNDGLSIVAVFDKRGRYVYMGNGKGGIQVLHAANFTLKSSFRIHAGSSNPIAVKSIEFSRRGNCFLVNSADRIIRVYDAKHVLNCGINGEPQPLQKLQDLVNRSMWKKCTFSGDGEYICAGSARLHSLYIWEKSSGSLVKILHGAKGEMFLDVVWHPLKPIIASIGSGLISLWAQNHMENWSAFAPNFKELDENMEYEEHESEFDCEDEDKSLEAPKEDKSEDNEDIEVDITSVDVDSFLRDSDEESDHVELDILPMVPEIEMPEEWEPVVVLPLPEKSAHEMLPPPPPVPRGKPVVGYPRVEQTGDNLKLKIKLGTNQN